MEQSDEIGLIPPPPGVTPNFDDPSSTGWKVIVVAMVTWGLASVFVMLRVFVKLKITCIWKLEDWFLIIGWLFATGLTFLSYPYVYHSGLGRHAWDVTFSNANPSFFQSVIAYAVLYFMSLCFIKLSICILFIRLARFRVFLFVVYLLMFFIIAYSLVSVLLIIFRCHPLRKAWDITVTYGSYFSLLLLPIFILRGLLIPMRQKVLIAFILMTSSFVCVISVLRQVETYTSLGLTDPTRSFVRPAIYGLLESNTATICVCLPYMKSLLRRFSPRVLGEEEETSAAGPFARPSQSTGTEMEEAGPV